MAAYDEEVTTNIWNEKIPLKITLDPSEIAVYGSDKTYDPIQLEVPRCSYLPLVTEKVQALLVGLGMREDLFQTVWYDYNKEPLKWHYPIGLLYDLQSTVSLPWSLTLHFKSFPADELIKNPSISNMQDMFMSMVKEADFLRHGSTKKVMNLSKRDQSQLWQSVSIDNYNDYWMVNKGLVEHNPSIRHLPLRIYLPDNCPVIQELVTFHDEQESIPLLLGDVLTKVLPDLFPKEEEEAEEKEQEEEEEKEENVDKQKKRLGKAVIHGIELPLDTPIHWASNNLSFPDHFLHIVVKPI